MEDSGSKLLDDEYSIHEKMQKIIEETDVDRKSELSGRINAGDRFTKVALSVAFAGFWIFWAIVALL